MALRFNDIQTLIEISGSIKKAKSRSWIQTCIRGKKKKKERMMKNSHLETRGKSVENTSTLKLKRKGEECVWR